MITVEAIAPSADLDDIVITAKTLPPPNVEGVPCNDPCEPVTLKLTAYADKYQGYVQRNADIDMPIIMVMPIVVTHRPVSYHFVLGNNVDYNLGETLYRTQNDEWSFDETDDNNQANAPIFTINSATAEIKTAMDFSQLTNLPDSLLFTIQATHTDHPEQYDRVIVTLSFINLIVDLDRDGEITNADEYGKPKAGSWADEQKAIILFNGDDDDGKHFQDNLDDIINGQEDLDDDIGPLWFKKLVITKIPDDFKIELMLETTQDEDAYWQNYSIAPADRVRVFLPTARNNSDHVCQEGDRQILGPGQATVEFIKNPPNGKQDISIFAGTGTVKFGIEGIHPGAPAKIIAKVHIGSDVIEDVVEVRVSPFIAFSHVAPVQPNNAYGPAVFVSEVVGIKLGTDINPSTTGDDNTNLRLELAAKYAKDKEDEKDETRLSAVDVSKTSGQSWWQDPFEIGYVQSPYRAALNAIKWDNPFKVFYEKLIAKGKKFKVAIVAVMRKMVSVLNSMLKTKNTWKEKNAQK